MSPPHGSMGSCSSAALPSGSWLALSGLAGAFALFGRYEPRLEVEVELDGRLEAGVVPEPRLEVEVELDGRLEVGDAVEGTAPASAACPPVSMERPPPRPAAPLAPTPAPFSGPCAAKKKPPAAGFGPDDSGRSPKKSPTEAERGRAANESNVRLLPAGLLPLPP